MNSSLSLSAGNDRCRTEVPPSPEGAIIVPIVVNEGGTAEWPRLSFSSDDSFNSDDSTCTSVVLTSSEGSITPPVALGPIVVNAGGTGILHGNVNSYTLNQYIVPSVDAVDWKTDVKDLVTDAATKISSDTKEIFFPKGETQLLPGDKDNLRTFKRKWCLMVCALVGLSLAIIISTLLLMMHTSTIKGFNPKHGVLVTTDEMGMEGADMPGAPRLMSRSSWVAQPSNGPLDPNDGPFKTVIICHTAGDFCNSTPACVLKVRYIQQFHIESRGWADISYNFLVGGDGCVYVGRGWDKMGAHTKSFNNGTIGVAFVGTYEKQVPSETQMEAFNRLMRLGVKLGKLDKDYILVAQCQLQPTAAPGAALVKDMRAWPHYNTTLSASQCKF